MVISQRPQSGVATVQELEQRYNRFRVEVQVALDAGEAVSYQDLARRLARKDKQAAAAAFIAAPAARAGGGAAAKGRGCAPGGPGARPG
jgi:hypothetical protein